MQVHNPKPVFSPVNPAWDGIDNGQEAPRTVRECVDTSSSEKVTLQSIGIAEGTENRPLDEANILEIQESLPIVGQLQSIGVDLDGYLIWGFHRYEAMKRIGWKDLVLVRRIDVGDLDIAKVEALLQIHENKHKAMTIAEIVARADAAGIEYDTGSAGGTMKDSAIDQFKNKAAKKPKGRKRDAEAKAAGKNKTDVARAKKIKAKADSGDEKAKSIEERINSGEITIKHGVEILEPASHPHQETAKLIKDLRRKVRGLGIRKILSDFKGICWIGDKGQPESLEGASGLLKGTEKAIKDIEKCIKIADNLDDYLSGGIPSDCTECDCEGCEACDNTGWVIK